MWGNDNPWGYAVCDVRIGTLDFPGIMEPDAHSFVGSKLGWIGLPAGARTLKGHHDYKEFWPKSSLERLEICLERFEANKKAVIGQKDQVSEETVRTRDESVVDGDGEKTPTATADVDDAEDDEAFEKRFKETEQALQQRLEKLSLKLESEDQQDSSTTTT